MAESLAFSAAGSAETREDFGEGDEGVFAFWAAQEKIAEKQERNWIKRARKVAKRYLDDRAEAAGTGRDQKKYNILWSNVETLKPVLYARTPKADVQRRFKDADPTGRLASIVLERALNYSLETQDFDGVMKSVVQDRLLPGRGVARVLYVPHYGDEIPLGDESDTDDGAGEPADSTVADTGDEAEPDQQEEAPREVVFEEAKAAYVYWEDYREGPARVWAEVPWVRYRSYMSKDKLTARFGKEKADKITLDYAPKDGDSEKGSQTPDVYTQAIVYEYWHKDDLTVTWIAPGTPDLVLDAKPDPLKLNGFYPNAQPLLATVTTEKRIPVPDYAMYQDQASTVDDLTQRINKLTRALRAKGIYAGEEKDALQRLMDLEDDAILIPVENFGAMAAKGGLGKIIEWLPIEQIAQLLQELYAARDKEIQVIYQITGLSDILRGETNPMETKGAQVLKSNFATRRIMPKQKDVAAFARDLIRLQASIIAQHFSGKTLSMITGYPQLQPVPPMPAPPQPPPMPAPQPMGLGGPQPVPQPVPGQPAPQQPPNPAMQQYQIQMQQYQQQVAAVHQVMAQNQALQKQFDDAVALLKRDAFHDFRIDIEADSTIAVDEEAEKESRTEFLQQMIPLLETVIPIAQGNPPLADLSREIVMFAMRAYPTARNLEETFENAFEQLKHMPPNPNAKGAGKGGEKQDPKVAMAEVQQKAQEAQQANSIKQQQVTGELQLGAQREQARAQYDQQKLELDARKADSQIALKAIEMQRDAEEAARGLT